MIRFWGCNPFSIVDTLWSLTVPSSKPLVRHWFWPSNWKSIPWLQPLGAAWPYSCVHDLFEKKYISMQQYQDLFFLSCPEKGYPCYKPSCVVLGAMMSVALVVWYIARCWKTRTDRFACLRFCWSIRHRMSHSDSHIKNVRVDSNHAYSIRPQVVPIYLMQSMMFSRHMWLLSCLVVGGLSTVNHIMVQEYRISTSWLISMTLKYLRE